MEVKILMILFDNVKHTFKHSHDESNFILYYLYNNTIDKANIVNISIL